MQSIDAQTKGVEIEAREVGPGMYVKTDKGEFIRVRDVSHSKSGMNSKVFKVLIVLQGDSGHIIRRGTDTLEVYVPKEEAYKGTCPPPPTDPGTSM